MTSDRLSCFLLTFSTNDRRTETLVIMAPAVIAGAGRCVAVVYSATIAIMSIMLARCTMGSALGNQPVLEGFRPQHLRGLNTCDQEKACSHLMAALTIDLIISSELSYLKLFHCIGQRNGMGIEGFHSTSENANETEAWISYEGKNYSSVCCI